mgnify:CR=1 FL=1
MRHCVFTITADRTDPAWIAACATSSWTQRKRRYSRQCHKRKIDRHIYADRFPLSNRRQNYIDQEHRVRLIRLF